MELALSEDEIEVPGRKSTSSAYNPHKSLTLEEKDDNRARLFGRQSEQAKRGGVKNMLASRDTDKTDITVKASQEFSMPDSADKVRNSLAS